MKNIEGNRQKKESVRQMYINVATLTAVSVLNLVPAWYYYLDGDTLGGWFFIGISALFVFGAKMEYMLWKDGCE